MSVWKTLDTVVRSGSEGKEAVLQYYGKAITLNVKRSGMQVCIFRDAGIS
jgi:hypothetical protein